jgi:hypothetical protein
MASIKRLPSDIWLLILEYLNPGDLYVLFRSFERSFLESALPSLANSRAIKTIYELLMFHLQIPRVIVDSDKSLGWLVTPQPEPGQQMDSHPVDMSYTYCAQDFDITPSFSPTSSSSTLKMTLTTKTKDFESYCPDYHGGEPHEPTSVTFKLNTNPDGKAPFIQLEYDDLGKSAHTVDDIHHHERFTTRTVSQSLVLREAVWVWTEMSILYNEPSVICHTIYLPSEWFTSLGLGEVHVKVTFDKKGSIDSTLEDWIKHESDLQYMAVLFENLKLPTSPSLLKLFPKEVLEGLPK